MKCEWETPCNQPDCSRCTRRAAFAARKDANLKATARAQRRVNWGCLAALALSAAAWAALYWLAR